MFLLSQVHVWRKLDVNLSSAMLFQHGKLKRIFIEQYGSHDSTNGQIIKLRIGPRFLIRLHETEITQAKI